MRDCKKDYYTKLLNCKRNNVKEMWKVLNNVIGGRMKNLSYPYHFMVNNNIIRDKQQIVDGFNSFFVNVGPELRK